MIPSRRESSEEGPLPPCEPAAWRDVVHTLKHARGQSPQERLSRAHGGGRSSACACVQLWYGHNATCASCCARCRERACRTEDSNFVFGGRVCDVLCARLRGWCRVAVVWRSSHERSGKQIVMSFYELVHCEERRVVAVTCWVRQATHAAAHCRNDRSTVPARGHERSAQRPHGRYQRAIVLRRRRARKQQQQQTGAHAGLL